jgi:hypothetical protein
MGRSGGLMGERVELANADDNLCFGCGPENPMGLRLRFYLEDGVVSTDCVPNRWWSGQPGVVNPGILYAILIDLAIWTASGVLNRVPLFPKTNDLRLGDMTTSRPIHGDARIVKSDPPLHRVRAELSQDGERRAWLDVDLKVVSRDEYRKARPSVEIPDSLEGLFEGD